MSDDIKKAKGELTKADDNRGNGQPMRLFAKAKRRDAGNGPCQAPVPARACRFDSQRPKVKRSAAEGFE
jgi:hypothetical protein